eukprot:3934950-Prymnesium_polylepis.1
MSGSSRLRDAPPNRYRPPCPPRSCESCAATGYLAMSAPRLQVRDPAAQRKRRREDRSWRSGWPRTATPTC